MFSYPSPPKKNSVSKSGVKNSKAIGVRPIGKWKEQAEDKREWNGVGWNGRQSLDLCKDIQIWILLQAPCGWDITGLQLDPSNEHTVSHSEGPAGGKGCLCCPPNTRFLKRQILLPCMEARKQILCWSDHIESFQIWDHMMFALELVATNLQAGLGRG